MAENTTGLACLGDTVYWEDRWGEQRHGKVTAVMVNGVLSVSVPVGPPIFVSPKRVVRVVKAAE